MRCSDGLAARHPKREAPGGSINVSIRKRRPAMGTPPARARWRASCGPPADTAAISTIHYANPRPVHLNEGALALRHPYVASSKSTCRARVSPRQLLRPGMRAFALPHAPRLSRISCKALSHMKVRGGGPAFAYARSQDIFTAALNGEQQVRSRRRSKTESPIQSIELNKGSKHMPTNNTPTSPARDSTPHSAARCVSPEFLRADHSSEGCWPFHACAICAPPT